MNQSVLLAIALLFLGLEHLGVPIPGWITGIILIIVAILMFI